MMADQVLGTIPPPPGFSNAEQRQHREDFLPKLTKCGAIAKDESFEPNTLEISIHPILAKENWEPTQLGELWTDIRPALQLASHFLTEPGCLKFWAKLIYGHIVYGPKITIENPQYTPEILQDTRAVLEKLAQVCRFYPEAGTIPRSDLTHAKTQLVHIVGSTEPASLRGNYPDFRCQKHLQGTSIADKSQAERSEAAWKVTPTLAIELHAKIWDGYRNLTNPSFADQGGKESQKSRLNFGLAITLLHEISHAVWYFARLDDHPELQDHVYLETDSQPAEIGFAWENWSFSAILLMMSNVPVTLQCFYNNERAETIGSHYLKEHQPSKGSKLHHEEGGEAFKTSSLVAEGSSGGGRSETSTDTKIDEEVELADHPHPIGHPLPDDPALWTMGYFPGCPIYWKNVYQHPLQNEAFSGEPRTHRVWHLVPMKYVSEWFQKATWDKMRLDKEKAVMPQLQSCGVIIEEYKDKDRGTVQGFHGDYVVYGSL